MDSRFFSIPQNGHVLRILAIAAGSPGFDLIIRDRGEPQFGRENWDPERCPFLFVEATDRLEILE